MFIFKIALWKQRMFRRIGSTALACLILFSVSGTVFAEIPEPLRVSLVTNIYPLSFVNEYGDPDGIYPLIISEIARENRLEIVWVEGDWAENLLRSEQGEIDLMTSLVYTSERDEYLDYNSESAINAWSQVFQLGNLTVDNIFDLEDKKIGLMFSDQNAAGFVELADSFGLDYIPVYYDSFIDIVADMEAGIVEAGVFYSLYHISVPELIPTSVIFQPSSSFVAVPEGADTEILELIDRTLVEWKEDKDSYYYREVISFLSPTISTIPRWILILVSSLVGIALLALFFILALRRQVHLSTSELLESQSAYRSTFVNSVVGITHTDIRGNFLRVNPSFCEFLNRPEVELIGRSFHTISHPDDLESEMPMFDDLVSGKRDQYRINKRYLDADGDILWGSLSVSSVKGETGEILYLVNIVEDITLRKSIENKLGDLESRYLGLFQNSFQMTAILDELGRLMDINETMKQEFNLPADLEGILGGSMEDMDWMGPVVSLRMQEMVDECLSTGRTIRQTISPGETQSMLSFDISIKPIPDLNGNIRYCLVEAHDVTELMALTGNLEIQVEERTREIKLAQDRLVEVEKMASLGRLVAGVAHEINTPVGVAKTGVSYMNEQLSDIKRQFSDKTLTEEGFVSALDSLEDLAQILDENLERAIKLIQDFKLTSADQSRDENIMVNVRDYLTAILHTVTPKLKEAGIVWNIDAPDEEHCLFIGALNPIIVNLAINTISHAFEDSTGGIDITYRAMEGKQIITFSDNGVGIPEEHLSRVFEPFYTTGRVRGFTGLGLNIVYNLVKEIMGGTIVCESHPGAGTTFRIEFPDPGCPS